MELKTIVESLIFASDKPLTLKQLKALTGNTKAELIKSALDDIEAEFQSSGIQLAEVGGGYQFRTHPDAAPWVKRLLAGRPPRLTQAMLETLAIIAYRQPITRPEIEDIRGVDCGGVIRLLAERSLVRIVGKKEEPGRPILYGTTRQFLEFFNLKDLSALPTLKEFTELSEEMAGELEAFDEGSERPEDGEPASAALGPTEPLDAALTADAAPAPAEAALELDATPEPALELDATPEPAPEAQPSTDAVPEPDVAPLAATPAPAEAAPELDATPEPPGLAPAPVEGAAGPQTWARAGAAASAAPGEGAEDEEDGALVALDRAMERVQGVLRAHQQAERARLKTLLADAGTEPPLSEPPETSEPPAQDDPPGSSSSDDRPPEEL